MLHVVFCDRPQDLVQFLLADDAVRVNPGSHVHCLLPLGDGTEVSISEHGVQMEDCLIRKNTSTPEEGGGVRIEVESVLVQNFQSVPIGVNVKAILL